MEKREFVISYRTIGDHIVKLIKVARRGRSGYFNEYEYKLVIDNEVKSAFNTSLDLTSKNFKNIFTSINESNIDLLIGKFNLGG